MSSIRTVSLEYGDTRISIYLIELPGGRRDLTADPTPVLHSHFYYEIHFAARGQCLYRFSDREVLLRENEMLVIPPGLLHGSVDKYSASHTLRVLSLSLTPTEAAGKFHSSFIAMLNGGALTPLKAPAALSEQMDLLQNRELYGSLLGVCQLKAAASELIFGLFRQLSPFAAQTDTAPAEPQRDAEVSVLLENMVNRPDITLEQIAAAINYSTRHTARLIKSIYGASLSEIRRSRKVK